jgi:hypothetical protein
MKWVKNKQKKKRTDWHLWFAWKPVIIGYMPDGNEERAWFENVLRRRTLHVPTGISYWEYKALPNEKWEQKPILKEKAKIVNFDTTTPPQTAFCIKLDDGEDTEITEFITPTLEESEGRGSDITSLTGHPCEDCPDKGNINECCECQDIDLPPLSECPGCNCMTKTPEVKHHDPECKYRDFMEFYYPDLTMELDYSVSNVGEEEDLDHQTKIISSEDIRTCNICKRPRHKEIILPDGRCYDCRYDPCSKCGGKLDSYGDCTNEDCPLSSDEWVAEKRVCWSCQQEKHLSEFTDNDDGEVCNDCWNRMRELMPRDSMECQVCNVIKHKDDFIGDGVCVDCHDEQHEEPEHEIDIAWEVKRARKSKTIL